MILGQRIKEEREKRQWTQDYLAETLNVSRQTISKWEVGSTYPDIDRLVQISNLFGITLDSLIKGDDSLKKSIVITKTQRHKLMSGNLCAVLVG
ncbi:HTH-type transcriptional regulator ImmR (plasmid) [Weissella cibaria]|nr:helix-turn-helix transcriptional regulator [Weissella cibaria]APU63984.1 HTH-type transcriptional regulator ImmR [Weissella cibaria]